jgi:hypothetical protein
MVARLKQLGRRPQGVSMMHITVPNDLKAWLNERAREDDRSLTSTVVRCLTAEMKRERETERA